MYSTHPPIDLLLAGISGDEEGINIVISCVG